MVWLLVVENPFVFRNRLISSYFDIFLLILIIRFRLFGYYQLISFCKWKLYGLFDVVQFIGKLLRQHSERGGEVLVFHEDAFWHVE